MGRTFINTAAVTFMTLVGAARAYSQCGDIKCMNNSTCMVGSNNFEDHVMPDGTVLSEIHDTNTQSHCLCEPGWTGVTCDVPFRSCDGAHKCYHGGKCVLGLMDMYDNEQHYCDCDEATDEDGNFYVGKFCEQKSMTYCDSDPSRFCLNGGLCNQEYVSTAGYSPSCYCDDKHEGEHCEYEINTVPDCSLDCQNGGTCKLGNPPKTEMDFFNVTGKAVEVLQYCECRGDWHGQLCEVAAEPCGEKQCFHGSKCTEKSIDGEKLLHCDCRYANTDEHSYAGKFCQYEATQYCDKDSGGIQGHLFCVNGGTCQEDAYLGCICPEGFKGFSCEYYVDENADEKPNVPPPDDVEDTICSLDCNGRGTCRKGIKEKPDDEKVGDAEHLNGDEALANDEFQHCVCQDGWTGLQCEHQATECGSGDHYCFHGGECYSDMGEQKCDCSNAESTELDTNYFAGDQCEHPATEICLDGHTFTPNQGLSFCVNYGTCKAKVKAGEPHPGCNCDEEKWTGPHCEIKVEQAPVPAPSPTPAIKEDSDKGDKALQVIAAIVAVTAVLFVIGFALRQCQLSQRKQRMDKNSLRWESNRSLGGYRDEPVAEVNLSPRRDSNIKPLKSTELSNKPPSRASAPSSRDPFAAHLVAPPIAAPPLNAPPADDGPQVYLGPPQDEDGHVLHSVDII